MTENIEHFSPHSTDAEDEEKAENSLDDGGPLDVSALSVNDNNDDEKEEENDDEIPPMITMEDLADDLDSSEENKADHGADSHEMEFVEVTPRENSASEKPDKGSDNDEKDGKSVEHPKLPKESSMQIEDIDSNFTEESSKGNHRNGHLKSRKDNFGGYHAPSTTSQRNWQTRHYSPTESYSKYSHLNELDEDVILMRAKAALRRANRFSPPKGTKSYSYDPHSLSLSDLSLNAHSTWEPVRMSTPLVPQTETSTGYRGYSNHDSHYGYKSISRSHQHDFADVMYCEESGLSRSGGEMTSHNHHGVSGRRLSPAVEDIIRRRKLHGDPEGNYAFSTPWRKPSSPLYDREWQLSRTHPMSYVEWKAIYWRPPKNPAPWRDNHRYPTGPYSYEPDLKRLSWPPRPLSSKLIYGSRPLSPPVSFPPAKVPRAVSGGYVSKIALPSYQNSSDSGFSDWQQSTSRWENATRSHHSSLGYSGDFRFY